MIAPDEDNGGATRMSRNFEIRVDGTVVTPIPVEPSPKRVALLLDVSSSVRSRFPIALVADTLKALQPSDEVAFVAFATEEELSIGPTTDRSTLLSSITSASVSTQRKSGHTAMRDALARIVGRKKHYDAVVLFTDGDDNASKTKQGALKKLIEASDVRIFALIWVDREFATPEEAFGPEAVRELVDLLGGVVLRPWRFNYRRDYRLEPASKERLAALVDLLARAIDTPTMVSITWSDPRPKSSNPFKITVRDERGRKVDDRLVAYPRRRAARCATAQAGGATPAKPN